MAKGHEAVVLGLARGGEEVMEVVGDGVPAKAAYEEVALGNVEVCKGKHSREDISVADGGVLEDVKELVRREAFHDLAGVCKVEHGVLVGISSHDGVEKLFLSSLHFLVRSMAMERERKKVEG